eukprot:scaffold1771_cov211-Alexandrium_tamarense.AAC.1
MRVSNITPYTSIIFHENLVSSTLILTIPPPVPNSHSLYDVKVKATNHRDGCHDNDVKTRRDVVVVRSANYFSNSEEKGWQDCKSSLVREN